MLLVCASIATLSVKGFREKIWEFFVNIGNPSYSFFVSSENDNTNKLSAYEGQYIPTWIPEGYDITFMDSQTYYKTIEFKNADGKTISYSEYPKNNDSQFYIDKENCDSYEVCSDNGRETIVISKNGVRTLIITEKDAIIQVVFTDIDFDILSFAETIEKK